MSSIAAVWKSNIEGMHISYFCVFRITLFALVMVPLSLQAQCVVTLGNHGIHVGDSLSANRMPYCNVGNDGVHQVWDFSQYEADGTYKRYYVLNPDSAIWGYDERETITYHTTDNSLLQVREESSLHYINYSMPRLAMYYPLHYGDSIAAPFWGEGKYCDRMFLRRFGMVNIKADGYGTLIRAEGDTLRDVLRVYHVTTSALRQDIDSCANDSDSQQQEITERYLWYVQNHRYPVYEVVTSTYYHAMEPYATHQLARRYGNDCIEEDNEISDDENSSENDNDQENPLFTYTVSNSQNHVTVNYDLQHPARITLIIADIMGMLKRNESFVAEAGSGSYSIDCTGLPHGQYILYLNVDGSIYSNKIII